MDMGREEENGLAQKKNSEGGGRGDNGWTQICNNQVYNLDTFHQCRCSGLLCDIPLKSDLLVPTNW
jgi:hypothetical protein